MICGAISQYNNTTAIKGPSNYLSLLVNRASMTGMVVFDYADRFAKDIVFRENMVAQGGTPEHPPLQSMLEERGGV